MEKFYRPLIADPEVISVLEECLTPYGYQPCDENQPGCITLWDMEGCPKHKPVGATIGFKPNKSLNDNTISTITTPFRLSALLRMMTAQYMQMLTLGDGWSIDLKRRALKHHSGKRITLTEKETVLLSALLSAPDRALGRQALLEAVWGYGDNIDTHTLETHMHRLRSKCEKAGIAAEWIQTTGDGYRLETK